MATQLHDLLNTKNKSQQVERVQQLLNAAGAPVIDLVVRVDTRTQQIGVTVIGIQELDHETAYAILQAAQDNLRKQAIAALQKQAQPNEGQAAPQFSTPETIDKATEEEGELV